MWYNNGMKHCREQKNNNLGKVDIKLPSMILIPIFSIIFSIIKLCGGTSMDWCLTIVVLPMATYFGWSILFLVMAYMCIAIVEKNKKQNQYKEKDK